MLMFTCGHTDFEENAAIRYSDCDVQCILGDAFWDEVTEWRNKDWWNRDFEKLRFFHFHVFTYKILTHEDVFDTRVCPHAKILHLILSGCFWQHTRLNSRYYLLNGINCIILRNMDNITYFSVKVIIYRYWRSIISVYRIEKGGGNGNFQ